MIKNALKTIGQSALHSFTLPSEAPPTPTAEAGPSHWKDQVVRCDDAALRQLFDVHARSHGSRSESLLPFIQGRTLVHPFPDHDPKGKAWVRTIYVAGPTISGDDQGRESVPPIKLSYAPMGYLSLRATLAEDASNQTETFYFHKSSPQLLDGKIVTLSFAQCKRAVDEASQREALERAAWRAAQPQHEISRYAQALRLQIASAPRYNAESASDALATCPPKVALDASRSGEAPLPKKNEESLMLAMYRGADFFVVSRQTGTRLSRAFRDGGDRLRMYAKPLGEAWQGPWLTRGHYSSSGFGSIRVTGPASAESSAPRNLALNFDRHERFDRIACVNDKPATLHYAYLKV